MVQSLYLSLSTFHLKCLYFVLFIQVFYGCLIMNPSPSPSCLNLNHSGLCFDVLVTLEQNTVIFSYRSTWVFALHPQGLLINTAQPLQSSLSPFFCFGQWVEFSIVLLPYSKTHRLAVTQCGTSGGEVRGPTALRLPLSGPQIRWC